MTPDEIQADSGHPATLDQSAAPDNLDQLPSENSSPDELIKLIRRHLRLAELLKDDGDDLQALSACREILLEIKRLAAAVALSAKDTKPQSLIGTPSQQSGPATDATSLEPVPTTPPRHPRPFLPDDFIRFASYKARELIFNLGKTNRGMRDHDNKAELRSLCVQALEDPEVSQKRKTNTFKTLINIFLSYPGAIKNEPHQLLTAELMDCVDSSTLKFTSLRFYNTGNLKAAIHIKEYLLTRPDISPREKAETLKYLSANYEELGDFETAIETLERLLKYVEKNQISDDIAHSLGFRAKHHIFRLKVRLHGEDSQGPETIAARRKLYEDLITGEEKAGNDDLLLAYHNLSFLYEEMGDLRKALAAIIKAGELMAESSGGYKNRIIQVKNRRFALLDKIRLEKAKGRYPEVLIRPKDKTS